MLATFVMMALAFPAGDAAPAEKAAGPRILARAPLKLRNGHAIIRSAEELARGGTKTAEGAAADLARALKVDGIDWDRQMVIVVSGGVQRTGGYRVEVTDLRVQDKTLTVAWKLHAPRPGGMVTQALTTPALTLLVDRFEGQVVFDPPAAPARGPGRRPGVDAER